MKFNLDINFINDILKDNDLKPLKIRLDVFPNKKRTLGQDYLKAGYEIGLQYNTQKNEISSRLGFIGEIGIPLYTSSSCIRQRFDKNNLMVDTLVDKVCLPKKNVVDIMEGPHEMKPLKLNVGQSNFANYYIPHKDALGVQQLMGLKKYTI